jgi:hypothetical protein
MLKKEWKLAFYSAIVIGFLTHMYVFTNMLPNHDGLLNIYSAQLKFSLGRFFLSPFSGISSFFDLAWINGSLSILYLALTVVVLVELFELRKSISIVLTAGLIMTFPTIGSTFAYMFTADGYMMGFLLAVLAILMTKKYNFGFLPASVLFYLSVGIYQANLSIVLIIVTVWFIRELVFREIDLKSIFQSLLRFVAMTTIGMASYMVTFKLYQSVFAGEVSQYQGINQVGINFETMVQGLEKVQDATLDFFFRGYVTNFPVNLFEVLNVLLIALILFALILSIIINKVYVSASRIFLTAGSVCILPVFAFILYFISPDVIYHMLMYMALVFVYLLPIVVYDRLEKPILVNKGFSWVTVLTMFVIIFNFAIINNIAYFNMTLKYERSNALMIRILDRIEQTPGYEDTTELAVIGRPQMETGEVSQAVIERIPKMTGAIGETFLAHPYHFTRMMANQFGTSINYISGKELDILKESEFVKEMETWPSQNAVRVAGDTVIIKFSE